MTKKQKKIDIATEAKQVIALFEKRKVRPIEAKKVLLLLLASMVAAEAIVHKMGEK